MSFKITLVSNQQQLGCLFNKLFKLTTEKALKFCILALCWNTLVTRGLPSALPGKCRSKCQNDGGLFTNFIWASCILYLFSGLHLVLHTHIIVIGEPLEYLNMMNNIKERKAPATTIIRWNWEKSLEMENYEFSFTQCIYWLLSTKMWYL